MDHRLLSIRKSSFARGLALHRNDLCPPMSIGDCPKFLWVILEIEADYQCVTLPFAPHPMACATGHSRLACLRHAASVHPEPGSNSHKSFHDVSRLTNFILDTKSGRIPPRGRSPFGR